MNVKTKPFKFDGKKIAIIAVVLAIAGFKWYSDRQNPNAPTDETPSSQEYDYRINFPDGVANAERGTIPGNSTQATSTPYLISAGREDLKSPAGLIYSGGREHRAEHVLRHAEDIPDRQGSHGVFDAQGDDVFRLIDEAYAFVKNKSKRVQSQDGGNGKTEYEIDMQRRIGFKGGQTGKRQSHPALRKIKLVLADERVITAYPY